MALTPSTFPPPPHSSSQARDAKLPSMATAPRPLTAVLRDVLSALGVSLDLTPEQIAHAIEQIGIGFMFAAKFHPAMKHAIGPRKEIGQRTIFNVLGPLTNPAGANIQLTGVYAAALTEPLANVLKELGSRAALVIYGAGGTDELNTYGRQSHQSSQRWRGQHL